MPDQKPTHRFRVTWPIVGDVVNLPDLFTQAREDLPAVARRHRAHIIGQPRFEIRPAKDVPGSGGVGYVLTGLVHAVEAERPSSGDRPTATLAHRMAQVTEERVSGVAPAA